MTDFRRVWGIPVILGLLSSVGLASALIGDALWDGLSWLALGIPLAVIGWFVLRPRSANVTRRKG